VIFTQFLHHWRKKQQLFRRQYIEPNSQTFLIESKDGKSFAYINFRGKKISSFNPDITSKESFS